MESPQRREEPRLLVDCWQHLLVAEEGEDVGVVRAQHLLCWCDKLADAHKLDHVPGATAVFGKNAKTNVAISLVRVMQQQTFQQNVSNSAELSSHADLLQESTALGRLQQLRTAHRR